MQIVDITGKQFNWLTVLRRNGKNKWGQLLWLCRCECGKEITAVGTNIKRGTWKSCGCKTKELLKARFSTHGCSHAGLDGRGTPEYKSWLCMRSRCRPSSEKAHLYFERGIHICPAWENFSGFLSDMGPKPSPQHTLDRIDVNGNYEPSNCRWATPLEQGNNRRVITVLQRELDLLKTKLKKYEARYGSLEDTNAS